MEKKSQWNWRDCPEVTECLGMFKTWQVNPLQPVQTFEAVLAVSRGGGPETFRDPFQPILFYDFFFLNMVIKLPDVNKT